MTDRQLRARVLLEEAHALGVELDDLLAGYPVAQAFAGHTPPTVTGRYLHATIDEIATAVATLTGEPHPLAARRRHDSSCGRRSRPVRR